MVVPRKAAARTRNGENLGRFARSRAPPKTRPCAHVRTSVAWETEELVYRVQSVRVCIVETVAIETCNSLF
jgi:hypothetical protein